jgi:hypothetical protein
MLKFGIDAKEWQDSDDEEIFRLAKKTQTIAPILPDTKPKDRTASYYNPQASTKIKDGKLIRRTRGVIGGNIADPYPDDTAAYVADMITVKLLWNSVVSTPNARFMTMDITDFYLGTTLKRKAYMWIRRDQLSHKSIKLLGIQDAKWWKNDKVLFEIGKGIYGLEEAGKLAQDRLYEHLAAAGFHLVPNHTGLLQHDTRPIMFSLVVDDFGVKYINRDDVEYLASTLKQLYDITMDWSGSKYLGITVDHNYEAKELAISMPNYIHKLLERHHIDLDGPCTYSPAPYKFVPNGKQSNLNIEPDLSTLTDDAQQFIRRVVGSTLYYSRAVDPTMLCDTNRLGSQVGKATQTTETNTKHLLQYAATYPVVQTIFRASDMILRITSDASYSSESESRSRAGGYFDLISATVDPRIAPINGAIHVVSSILPSVVASAAEAEYGALFMNGQAGSDIRNKLIAMGHPQPVTPMITDNECAAGIATNTVKPNKTKSMDMRFHWIRDRIQQGYFKILWQAGKDNAADYFTKVHPPAHHRRRRHIYVTTLPIERHKL